MKRFLVSFVTAVILFSGGLATSWYLMVQKNLASSDASPTEAQPLLSQAVPGQLDAPEAPEQAETQLPVPVRGKPLTAEEVFRYGASIRGQYEALVKRQEQVDREAARLQLLQEDIRGSREELDGLESKLTGLVALAERLLARLEGGLADLDEKQQASAAQASMAPAAMAAEDLAAQLKTTKKISEVVSSMPDTDAAEYLRHLSNDGKLELAGRVLQQIEPRNAAKILGALQDPALMVQLTDEVLKSQAAAKKDKKTR